MCVFLRLKPSRAVNFASRNRPESSKWNSITEQIITAQLQAVLVHAPQTLVFTNFVASVRELADCFLCEQT